MSERSGVCNMHLSVDMSKEETMIMSYKVAQGYCKEEHYGIALAHVVGLPPKMIEFAQLVSHDLEARAESKKSSSKAFARIRKRKLVIGLHVMLRQARDGPMEGGVLVNWLRRLQTEFVQRMEQIDREVSSSDDEAEMLHGYGEEQSSERLSIADGSTVD
jgi:DNA mismatch repair protein MSH4